MSDIQLNKHKRACTIDLNLDKLYKDVCLSFIDSHLDTTCLKRESYDTNIQSAI